MMRRALIQCIRCSSSVLHKNERAARLAVCNTTSLSSLRLSLRRPFHSSLPTLSSEVTSVKEYTDRILEKVPVGAMEYHDWDEAYTTILCWTQQSTPESVKTAWRLLDRFVEEERTSRHTVQFLKTHWLNRIIEVSRIVTVEDGKGVTEPVVGPMEWIQRLDKYAPYVQPNVATYSMIMNSLTKWVCEPTVELVEELLDRMEAQAEHDESLHTAVGVYNAALHAWANSGLEEAPHRAEAVFQRMLDHGSDPDLVSYSSLITTWARSQDPNAGHRAEEILRMAEQEMELNHVVYNVTIQAWERSKHVDSTKRIDILFREMMDQYEHGNEDAKPDSTTFRIVIRKLVFNGQVARADAIMRQMLQMCDDKELETNLDRKLLDAIIDQWANARAPSAGERAESLLRLMNDLYMEGNEHMKPRVWNFKAVIAAWSKAARYNAANHAEAMLEWMQEFHQAGDDKMVPNTIMCSSIISAWSKSRDKSAPERAEALLQRMIEWYEAGNESVKPNIVTYNALMKVYAKSRHPEATQRMEGIMRKMSDMDIAPDRYSYNQLINAYANSKDPAAPERAESVLRHLFERQQAGDVHLKPDRIGYTTVVKAWANSEATGAADRAEAFLRYMEEAYRETGDEEVKPNAVSYAMAIKAWVNSGDPDAAKRASALLEEVHDLYKADTPDMKLKKQVYWEVLQLLAKSGDVDSGQVAERILLYMQDRALAGDTYLMPSAKFFNLTLRAWSNCGHIIAAQRAEVILNLMQDLYAQGGRPYLKPNRLTFNFVIKAWSRSGDVFAGKRAEQHLRRMQGLAAAGDQDLAPNEHTYGDLAVAWKCSGHADATKKAEKYAQLSKSLKIENDATLQTHGVERRAQWSLIQEDSLGRNKNSA